MPAMILIFALVLAALPRLSPKNFEIDSTSRAFHAITISVLVLMLAIHAMILLSAIGVRLPVTRIVPIVMGAMIAVIGNYLSKVRRNFFIGIRTPWTLADEDVWFRTHRFGGRLMVIAGVLCLLAGLFLGNIGLAFGLGAIVSAALGSVVSSYVSYRQKNAGS